MSIASYWDASAATFGLGDPRVRAAWADRLHTWVPDASAEVLDLGCGTGSLSAVLAAQGHRITGAAGDPPVGDRRFDAVLAMDLLRTLPDPLGALRRWVTLLCPGGRLILIEGRGIAAATLAAAVQPLVQGLLVEPLTDPALWGRSIHDERYALLAHT
jgi:2-polyprenyl-3-methyl-5-hydroxy-6-metoxy-1,4-benzoquinol methylase